MFFDLEGKTLLANDNFCTNAFVFSVLYKNFNIVKNTLSMFVNVVKYGISCLIHYL